MPSVTRLSAAAARLAKVAAATTRATRNAPFSAARELLAQVAVKRPAAESLEAAADALRNLAARAPVSRGAAAPELEAHVGKLLGKLEGWQSEKSLTAARHDVLTYVGSNLESLDDAALGHIAKAFGAASPVAAVPTERAASVAIDFTRKLLKKLAIPAERLPMRRSITEANPLAFFRANPAFFKVDVERAVPLISRRPPQMVVVGDAHLFNFGTLRTPDGYTCWGLNDFDQAFRGSPELDLRRLATSAVLTARQGKLNPAAQRDLVEQLGRAYFQELDKAASGPLPMTSFDEKAASGAVRDLIKSAGASPREHLLAKLTEKTKNGYRFLTNETLQAVSPQIRATVTDALAPYAERLVSDVRVKKPLNVIDVTEVLGKGGSSNGLDRYAVLVEHATKGKAPIVLELKNCPPVPADSVAQLRPSAAGEIVAAQHTFAARLNALTGTVQLKGKSFLVREWEAQKGSLDATALSHRTALEETTLQAARILARAHIRSGGGPTLAAWVGNEGPAATQRLRDFAVNYADQVERDFAAVTQAGV